MVNKPRTEAQSQYIVKEAPRPNSPALSDIDTAMQAIYGELPPEIQAMFNESGKHAFAEALTVGKAELAAKGMIKIAITSGELYAEFAVQTDWFDARVAGTSRASMVNNYLDQSMANTQQNLIKLDQVSATRIIEEVGKTVYPKPIPKPEKRPLLGFSVNLLSYMRKEKNTDLSENHGPGAASRERTIFGSKS